MAPHKTHAKLMKPTSIITLLTTVCLCLILISNSGMAASHEAINVINGGHQKLTLTVGKSTIIESPSLIKKVAVAEPKQVDVTVLSPRQIYLIGKAPGATNATIWGVDGRIVAFLDIEVMPDVTGLKEKLHTMLPNEKNLKVTGSADSIVLTGTVSNTANLSQVMSIANAYSPKVINLLEVGGVHQVMLEVRVAEMSRTLTRRLGINFNYISDGGNTFGLSLLNNLTRLGDGFPSDDILVTDSVGLIFRFLGGGATWTTFIDALKENGLTKILAEPTLIATSGKNANFLAGGEYPVPVPNEENIGIEYKTYGVGLNFAPTVLSNDRISMEVAPEVSQLDTSNSLLISGYVVPALTTRRVSTTVELADGQSFAIAGLLRDDTREIVSKYPLLGDIPVLGALFRSTSYQKNETELVIIVTPHLVKPIDMAKQTLPTDAFVEPNDFEFYLLGSLEGKGEAPHQAEGIPPASNEGGLDGDFGHIAPK